MATTDTTAAAASASTITLDEHGWAKITLPCGNQFRLRLPTAGDITEHCDGYDRCEFDVTFYHQH